MSFKITFEIITKIVLWTTFWILLATLSAPLMAETIEPPHTTKSISFIKSDEPNQTDKDTQLKAAESVSTTLITSGYRLESTSTAVEIITTSYIAHVDTIIFDATTDLISDFNNDGFYHRFSVTIDADTVFDTAYVYAQVYLSYEGGPWNHYATSENYHIYSDSNLDTFVIETELAEGYAPGYYDIRIELYDADLNVWLLSYGPYDDYSLSALPLEDSTFDTRHQTIAFPIEIETEIVVAGRGGAMSWLLLTIPFIISIIRRRTSNYIN